MKRILLSLAALIMAASATFAGNDKPITVDQLPDVARQFIQQYFSGTKISYAKMETEIFGKSYEVVFTNGCKVEFDDKGNWKEVDCKFAEVPEKIVPKPIRNYVATNYKDAKIVEIDRDKRDYEVKLNNGFELTFDLQFNLIEIDD